MLVFTKVLVNFFGFKKINNLMSCSILIQGKFFFVAFFLPFVIISFSIFKNTNVIGGTTNNLKLGLE